MCLLKKLTLFDLSKFKKVRSFSLGFMGCGASTVSDGNNENNNNSNFKVGVLAPGTVVDYKLVHSTVRWNKISDLAAMINNESVNFVDPTNGNCPIHIAAQNGHYEVLKYLIEKKAFLNSKNLKGNTAIHMAVGYDYYQCAKMLVDAGADQNIENDSGFPSNRGIEGDKSFGIAAFISAQTIEEALLAFTLCEENTDIVLKSLFVSTGMKHKKSFGDQWTPEIHDRFKHIIAKCK